MTVIDAATKQVRNCAISKQKQQNLQVKREYIFAYGVGKAGDKKDKEQERG